MTPPSAADIHLPLSQRVRSEYFRARIDESVADSSRRVTFPLASNDVLDVIIPFQLRSSELHGRVNCASRPAALRKGAPSTPSGRRPARTPSASTRLCAVLAPHIKPQPTRDRVVVMTKPG